ncbi:hypothetical protein TREES_T100015629 [Tupaia chinensis]|uniref:Uncharacterized protein n=1 Tax=Tupaia chinensis TaxID=246437 RepID=L9L7S8_TUPCH|nr:hypothetical protein TREES_T100015629 [Tupaia chinensis]
MPSRGQLSLLWGEYLGISAYGLGVLCSPTAGFISVPPEMVPGALGECRASTCRHALSCPDGTCVEHGLEPTQGLARVFLLREDNDVMSSGG